MKPSSGLFAAVLLALAAPALAQQPTLGELAKKTQEAKKGTTKQPAKTFTNDDLKKMSQPASAEGTTDASKDTKDSKDTKEPKDAKDQKDDASKPADAAKDPAKDEKYWRARMDSAREDLRRNQAFRDALQSRINGLTADFTARDDPYQRAQIADDRQKAIAELERVNKAIDDNNKAIGAIEDEARRAMVPPGWIR